MNRIILYIEKAIQVLKRDGILALAHLIYGKIQFWIIAFRTWFMSQIRKSHSVQNKKCRMVIFTGVPYDDVGGGQRAAQLAKSALRIGWNVIYIYLYPRFDFQKQTYISSKVDIQGLFHKSIKEICPSDLYGLIDETTTVIFELPHPDLIDYLRAAKIRGIHTVFELIDDWESSLGEEWFRKEIFMEFVKWSDIVIGTAQLLVERLRKYGREDAIYLPNAANEYIFDNYKSFSKPKDYPEGKTLIYFGSLYGEWFGWEYIQEIAIQNPNLKICLIGDAPQRIKNQIIASLKNIYFLGPKPIENLPSYLYHADACLLPFKPGQITDAVSPIKIFEYLFMNKPVIATKMKEILSFPNVLTSNDPKEFAQLCLSITEQKSNNQKEIDEFISKNSWFSRLQIITKIQGRNEVSVIILVHNNRNVIERCIRSLVWNCSSYLADIIVVDNASKDGSGDFVRNTFTGVKVIRNSVNGCASGRNLGVQYATGRVLAFFDSDQWFTSGFCFEEALQILRENANIGAVSWAAGWFDLSSDTLGGPIVDYLPHRGMTAEGLKRGFRTDVAYLGSGGMFVPRTVFEATGGFDPNFDPTAFEDTDLSFSIKKLGLELAYRDLTGIRHEAHRTTEASKRSPEYIELFRRNSDYFKYKWKEYKMFFKELK